MPPLRMRIVECGMRIANGSQASRPDSAVGHLACGDRKQGASERCQPNQLRWLTSGKQKMPDSISRPAFSKLSAIKQKLNCALPFRFSLSLGLFRFRGLNGISKTPKDFGLSRRPIQTDPARASSSCPIEFLLRKEVIQPQVPLRLPCYDFIPVTAHSVDGCLPLLG